MKNLTIIIGVLVVVLAYMVYKSDENENSLNQKQQELLLKNDSINLQLKRTELERNTLRDSIASLDSLHNILVLKANNLSVEITKIKNRYNKLSVRELEEEMERRAK